MKLKKIRVTEKRGAGEPDTKMLSAQEREEMDAEQEKKKEGKKNG